MVLDGMVEGRWGRCDFTWNETDAGRKAFDLSGRVRKSAVPYVKVDGVCRGERFLLVKPVTFMNESGKAVSSLRTKGLLKESAELLVVVDDIDLDVGKIRFREKGSAGGHNGMKSLIQAFGTNEFARIRIGVGPRPAGPDMVDYVLGSFRADEWSVLDKVLNLAVAGVEAWLTGGAEGVRRELSKAPQFSNPVS